MAADDVSLTELEVIAQFSLAVRAATAPRELVVAALEADLRALTGGAAPTRRAAAAAPARDAGEAPGKAPRKAPRKAPAGAATRAAAGAPGRATGTKAPSTGAAARTPRRAAP